MGCCSSFFWVALLLPGCIKNGYPNLGGNASNAYFSNLLSFPCPHSFSRILAILLVYVWVCLLTMGCFTYSWIRDKSLGDQSRKSNTIG